ncbi:MAG: VacB/RNase II family 3'-5' exoribonuclease, partial [Clostridiales bacterium]|nr:VacB/RNase II family 3'-5' exoribonuclease [Clostridiales bacterium]
NYVREGTPLDEEAYIRGTSIYLVDRVIPMLPHKLCNGICSLNPKEDRLTLSCIMEITPQGKVINHRITKSIICTNERMTYTDVNKIITEKDPELMKRYEPLVEMFLQMDELRKILNHRRKSRGSVNFELPEAKIVLDEAGHPTEIKPYEKNAATNLIEEFMLVCNETIAENFYWQEVPFVYRNHENPDEEKAQQLKIFLSNLGYRIKGKGEIRPKALQKVLEESEGKPEEHIVSRVVLRSMKQAKYMADNLGHFGLAAKFYCHFTSPIRRYPDLQIHRIIKETLDGKMTPKRTKFLTRRLPDVAKQCSLRERVAVDAERETDRLKMVEFMSDKIGNVYEGIISGVTGWGIYVELPNTVEGMIYVNDLLDDHYIFEEKSMQYTGIHTKKVYRLGDTVRIKVLKADKEMKTIDFTFAENE